MVDSGFEVGRSSCVYRRSTGRPESVVKCSLRSAGGFVFVLDIFASIISWGNKNKATERAGTVCRAPTGIDYNLRARRNELSAKKKNTRAKATAVAMSQSDTSRVQERRAAFSQRIPRNANIAPAISRKSCFRARQKRWKPPWRL